MKRLIPSIGIVLFIILYCYATTRYPGGSAAYTDRVGFDWVHNYWCDLLTTIAINGEANAAKPYGIVSMVFLCGIVAVFFFQFADAFPFSKRWRLAIKICGALSMFFGALIFTPLHNSMIGISSLFAIVPIIGIFKGMISARSYKYIGLGLVCAVLLGLCNYFYYTQHFIEWLALFQKIALASVLLWIVVVNVGMAKGLRANTAK